MISLEPRAVCEPRRLLVRLAGGSRLDRLQQRGALGRETLRRLVGEDVPFLVVAVLAILLDELQHGRKIVWIAVEALAQI